MSARRPGLGRSHGRLGWFRQHLDVSAGPATVPTVQPAPPPSIVRINHPVTRAPEHRCYRVVRHYKWNDRVEFEDIGSFDDPVNALLWMNEELGRARILGPDGKVYSDNLRTMEIRS